MKYNWPWDLIKSMNVGTGAATLQYRGSDSREVGKTHSNQTMFISILYNIHNCMTHLRNPYLPWSSVEKVEGLGGVMACNGQWM